MSNVKIQKQLPISNVAIMSFLTKHKLIKIVNFQLSHVKIQIKQMKNENYHHIKLYFLAKCTNILLL